MTMQLELFVWEGGTAPTAPALIVTGRKSTATPFYPVAGIGSTAYAARVIAARFRLSPAMARTVVELGGIGCSA